MSRGFTLGAIRFIQEWASVVQACGSMQCFPRLLMQSVHGHRGLAMCGMSRSGSHRCADIKIRSATVEFWCFTMRHFVVFVVMGCFSADGWYHVGSWARRFGDRHMAARFMWCFFAIFSILIMLLSRSASLGPFVRGCQDWRKALIRARHEVPGGAVALITRSVILAHVGRVGDTFKYSFSQVISITSFWAWRSRRFRPPCLIGLYRVSRVILGEESSSHIKSCRIFVRAFSMAIGMPCAFVRNCVWPLTIVWIIIFLPWRVGQVWHHLPRALWILSRIGSQGVRLLVWFPIHVPRERMAFLSLAMCIWLFSGVWSRGFTFHIAMTVGLCSSMPIGIISVFSILNFVPETLHHWLRILCASSNLSFLLRNRVVSSANRVISMLFMPGMVIPLRFTLVHIIQARGSMARLKRAQDRGSPCLMSRVTWKGLLRTPFIATWVCACW